MRIPTGTYRIQLNRTFGFQKVRKILPYLADLGISCIYASPLFKARKASPHGYDVVDPNRLNPELGSITDFEQLKNDLQLQHMAWLQDIVPNHMAFDSENKMLMDVLENGPQSSYRHFFDIDWQHPSASLREKLLAPFLGGYYGESLENGELRLTFDESGFSVQYYDWMFPLRAESYAKILFSALPPLRTRLGEDHPDVIKFLVILHVLKTLPSEEPVKERAEKLRGAKFLLWELYRRNADIRQSIDAHLEMLNGEKGKPESFNNLEELLEEQVFRLSYWKVADEQINYRRFFHLNDLICMRMEEEAVFDHAHALIRQLIEEGVVTGLRVDHIDGLADPAAYLKRLRTKAGEVYLVVEKILERQEELDPQWPVQGTTGYEFLNTVNGLFCQSSNADRFSRIYTTFSGSQNSGADLVYEQKKRIINSHMRGDMDNLARHLAIAASRDRHGSDLTLHRLRSALVEALAHFPVYRSYIDRQGSRPTDPTYVLAAAKEVRRRQPGLGREIDFISACLLAKPPERACPAEDERIQFVTKFQQLASPLMAKGFEDTFLYQYNRLLSLNEVGGDPYHFGHSLAAFHAFNRQRAQLWPNALNATATHDTKRGEDVRARINVLSELPEAWQDSLAAWKELNRSKKKRAGGKGIPDGNEEYFLYQTLIGTFPFDTGEQVEYAERIKAYGVKALREAKIHSDWSQPDTDYEGRYVEFIGEILDSTEENPFLLEFLPFCRKIAHYGVFNSLGQTLIKITAPGLPDFYQGTELWDFSLVDPDNRRPVDFKARTACLEGIRKKIRADRRHAIRELLQTKQDGRIKLFLIQEALSARRTNPEIFLTQNYIPLKTKGAFQNHVIAFARPHSRRWCLTIVPRFLTAIVQGQKDPLGRRVWADTEVLLPEASPDRWQNIFTSERLTGGDSLVVSEILNEYPVAMLLSEETA